MISRKDINAQLARMARPAGEFDAQRYFRGDHKLRFYNIGTDRMRAFARSVYDSKRDEWSIDDAMRFADGLIVDPYLETKNVGIEVVARFKRSFTPKLLPRWKKWLAGNYSANWATTDTICGLLIGPLLVQYPALVKRMHAWAKDQNMWVRRASIVGLMAPIRKGIALDTAYDIARYFMRILRTSSKKPSAGRYAKQARWIPNASNTTCEKTVAPFLAQPCATPSNVSLRPSARNSSELRGSPKCQMSYVTCQISNDFGRWVL